MKSRGLKCSAAVLLVLASTTASAQTGGDAIQGRVKEGQKVSITDDQGREFNGSIGSITAKSLTILSRGTRVDLPYQEIVRIDRPNDSLANGALNGLLVGALLAVVSIVAADVDSCNPGYYGCSDPGAGAYVVGTALLGGLGAAVGVGIDAMIHRERNIYRRGAAPRIGLSPTLARGVRGATLSVSW